ncbi:MAG: HNH endonuclease [Gemmataceae bacterium]|nr:HNH endonuclease [Gemmataceae bacterium]MCI0741007.1 HNH endonuclease [Gemmataceae bacterium]
MAEENVPARMKKAVARRARHCCEYCRSQSRFAMQSFSVEHIIPRADKGSTTLDNLANACQGCNNCKYKKTEAVDPATGQIVTLFHPRKHNWNDHFAWNEDCSLILGLTAIGRATVETLKLNREGLVNLRKLLFAAGEHPPSADE